MMRCRLAVVIAWIGLASASKGSAQHPAVRLDPANAANFAAVVYNENDPLAAPLANYYAEKRGIPAERVGGLKCPLHEEISREQSDREIAQPLRRIFTQREWWIAQPSTSSIVPTAVPP